MCEAGITNQLFLTPDLVLYCEAFLTTYRTFITPEELIKKLQYRYPFLWPPTLAPHLTPLTAQSVGSQPGERAFCARSHRELGGYGWCSALLHCAPALLPQARLYLRASFLV